MKTANLQTRTIRLAGICGLLLAWTACSDEAVVDKPVGREIPVTIKAEINTSEYDTRATEDLANVYDRSSFIENDLIRVTRTVANPDYRVYKLGSDGKTWSVQGNTPLSLRIGANYQATFPSNYAGIVPNQATKENYLASNQLQTPVATSSSGVLDFTDNNAFAHKNTKITLEFAGVAGATGGTGTTLDGTFSDFTITGNGLYTGGTNSEQMTFYRPDDQVATWHGIVYPKSTATNITSTVISLSLVYEKVKYTAEINCPMVAGKHYKYSLKIQNDVLVPDGMTIDPWKNGDQSSGELTPETTTP